MTTGNGGQMAFMRARSEPPRRMLGIRAAEALTPGKIQMFLVVARALVDPKTSVCVPHAHYFRSDQQVSNGAKNATKPLPE